MFSWRPDVGQIFESFTGQTDRTPRPIFGAEFKPVRLVFKTIRTKFKISNPRNFHIRSEICLVKMQKNKYFFVKVECHWKIMSKKK